MSEDKFLKAMSDDLGMVTAEEAAQVTGWVSTGNYALNFAISNRFASRGWPLGHVAEIYGAPSTGKTFLLLRAISEIQRAGGVGLYDDAENRLNADWARRKLGVDTTNLMHRTSGTVQEHWEFLSGILKAYEATGEDRPLMAVLDSIGILSTDKEMSDEFDTRDMTRAYNLRKLFRMLVKKLKGLPIAYLAANHTYSKIGASPWEKSEESSGGGGFKYQSSVRLSLRTPKKVKGDGDLDGIIIRAVVEKNSLTIPFREASLMIPFGRPISPYSGLIPTLLDRGYLSTTSNHKLVWQEGDTGISAHKSDFMKQDQSALELLGEYPELLKTVDDDLARRETGKDDEG